MKLNFWQWIGVIVVAIALIAIIIREMGETKVKPAPTTTPPAPTTTSA